MPIKRKPRILLMKKQL